MNFFFKNSHLNSLRNFLIESSFKTINDKNSHIEIAFIDYLESLGFYVEMSENYSDEKARIKIFFENKKICELLPEDFIKFLFFGSNHTFDLVKGYLKTQNFFRGKNTDTVEK